MTRVYNGEETDATPEELAEAEKHARNGRFSWLQTEQEFMEHSFNDSLRRKPIVIEKIKEVGNRKADGKKVLILILICLAIIAAITFVIGVAEAACLQNSPKEVCITG